ncbi:MAG: YhfC family glutamic-type intramembrane protease [Clostridiaceae bacterium]|nr:YhfC family glutamic-type intramembrane protease [Clostridiaceae bacterium]
MVKPGSRKLDKLCYVLLVVISLLIVNVLLSNRKARNSYRRFSYITDVPGIKTSLLNMRGIGFPKQPRLNKGISAQCNGENLHEEWFLTTIQEKVLSHPLKRMVNHLGKEDYFMEYTVPTLSIIFMAISALIGIVIPVVLFLVFRKKYKADVLPFFIGCAVFIVFALLFESFIHNLIFVTVTGKAILNNIWLYGIYGGLMAGLFEETGRYTAFKTVLRRKRGNNQNALMYGAGHGGFEAIYILGVSMISNIVMSVTLNAGMADKLTAGVTDPAALQRINATIASLAGAAPTDFLVGSVERFAAVALHISLSVLVWFAAKNGGRHFWLYPLAIILHTFINAVAVILSHYTSNLWLLEGAIYLISACGVMIAAIAWKKCASDKGVVVPIGSEGE